MNFSAKIVGDIVKDFQKFDRDLAHASQGAMREAAQGLKTELRAQITGAHMGQRLANTWQSAVYPKTGESKDAAASIYSKAPHIIYAYDHGTVIRARGGQYLAVPLPGIQKYVRIADKRKKITPKLFTEQTGIKLVFIKKRGGNPVLAAIGARRSKTGRISALRSRAATERRGERTLLPDAYGPVPMFVLIRQVGIARRLDVTKAFQNRGGRLVGMIDSRLGKGS